MTIHKILYLQSTSEIGGSDIALLGTLEAPDQSLFEPHVVLPVSAGGDRLALPFYVYAGLQDQTPGFQASVHTRETLFHREHANADTTFVYRDNCSLGEFLPQTW